MGQRKWNRKHLMMGKDLSQNSRVLVIEETLRSQNNKEHRAQEGAKHRVGGSYLRGTKKLKEARGGKRNVPRSRGRSIEKAKDLLVLSLAKDKVGATSIQHGLIKSGARVVRGTVTWKLLWKAGGKDDQKELRRFLSETRGGGALR